MTAMGNVLDVTNCLSYSSEAEVDFTGVLRMRRWRFVKYRLVLLQIHEYYRLSYTMVNHIKVFSSFCRMFLVWLTADQQKDCHCEPQTFNETNAAINGSREIFIWTLEYRSVWKGWETVAGGTRLWVGFGGYRSIVCSYMTNIDKMWHIKLRKLLGLLSWYPVMHRQVSITDTPDNLQQVTMSVSSMPDLSRQTYSIQTP